MVRRITMTAFLAYALGLVVSITHAQDHLRVDARVAKETYYAGQAIEVRVGVVAGGERPRVTVPKVDDATVETIDTAFRPIEVSGIGDAVSETNVFVTRYRVTPARAGPLIIPPFVARLGDRKGASSPTRLTIRAVPPEGRPASYLRGVGPIEARAEAAPGSVRVGQPFEYRVVLTGPGARGSTQWPVLPELGRVAGLSIKPAGTDAVPDPPSRTFRYRARATQPGTLALPSVAVATFDPTMKRYIETRAPSVAIRVVDVPRFDVAQLPAIPGETGGGSGMMVVIWIGLGALIVAAWGMVAFVRRKTSGRRRARRVARELGERPGEAADRIAAGLRDYLARAGGHRGGELTPDEAAHQVVRVTGDAGLAERARRLVERSDRARFGHADEGESGLAAEAVGFFEELARRVPRRS